MSREQEGITPWKGIAHLYGARVLGLLAGVGLSILAARALGPERQGNLATLKSAVLLGTQAANVGLSSSLTILFSRRRFRVGWYRQALWLWPASVGALLALAGAAFVMRGWAWSATTLWPLAVIWVPLQLLLLHQGSAFLALEETRTLGMLELGGRVAALGLGAAALVLFPARVDVFATALILSDLILVAAGAWCVRNTTRAVAAIPRRSRPFLFAALRLGLRAYPVLVIPFLLIRSDVLLVRALRGAREAGIYSIAGQLVDLALVLPATIIALVLPSLMRTSEPAAIIRRAFRPTLLVLVVLGLIMAVGGSLGIRLLFGSRYAEAYPALLLLLPGFVCLGLESLLAQYFAARGFPPFVAYSWLGAFALNLALNLVFLPRFGFLAAAASSSVGYAAIFAAIAWRFRKETSLGFAELVVGGSR